MMRASLLFRNKVRFILKNLDSLLKNLDFLLKNLDLMKQSHLTNHNTRIVLAWKGHETEIPSGNLEPEEIYASVNKNDEFRINNEELCI